MLDMNVLCKYDCLVRLIFWELKSKIFTVHTKDLLLSSSENIFKKIHVS